VPVSDGGGGGGGERERPRGMHTSCEKESGNHRLCLCERDICIGWCCSGLIDLQLFSTLSFPHCWVLAG
jgi:hypothetical protein